MKNFLKQAIQQKRRKVLYLITALHKADEVKTLSYRTQHHILNRLYLVLNTLEPPSNNSACKMGLYFKCSNIPISYKYIED